MKTGLIAGLIGSVGLAAPLIPNEISQLPIATAAIGAMIYMAQQNAKAITELQSIHREQLDAANNRFFELVNKLIKV